MRGLRHSSFSFGSFLLIHTQRAHQSSSGTGGGGSTTGLSSSKNAAPVSSADPRPGQVAATPPSSLGDYGATDAKSINNATVSDPPPPPPPPREVKRGKSAFQAELDKAQRQQEAAAEPKPNAAFLSKLAKLQEDGSAYAPYRSDERKRKKKVSMDQERTKLLVYRDVGMDLDKAILKRDILLIPKYFYYGVEFAIDNELERMLRYFNEHAINEMKIITDGKLMRGPERLAPKGFAFPLLDGVAKLSTFVAGGMDSGDAAAAAASLSDYGNPKTQTRLASTTFTKPTFVIFTQLGQGLGGQAERQWREVALEYLDPVFASQLSTTPSIKNSLPANSSAAAMSSKQPPSNGGAANNNNNNNNNVLQTLNSKPIAVLSLRSMDIYPYGWVHRLYLKRFLKSLEVADGAAVSPVASSSPSTTTQNATTTTTTSAQQAVPTTVEVNRMFNRWVTSSTVVGSGMFRPFFEHGIRNYLLPTVMLVDHRGHVRWVSAGLPDAKEKSVLPKLFQQLSMEYFKSGGSGGGGR